MVSFFRQKYFEKGVPIRKPVQNIPTQIIHSHPLLLILLFHPPKWHPRILTQPTYPYFTECSHLPVFLPEECRYLVWISGFPPLDCQKYTIQKRSKLLLTIHANYFKLSVRRNPRARVSKDVITSTTLKYNRQNLFCFQLIHCGNVSFHERIYRHFLWKISSWYLM